MDVVNDGGFLQFMPHGKNQRFTASMQAEQFRNTVPDVKPCDWMEAFFVHDDEKYRIPC